MNPFDEQVTVKLFPRESVSTYTVLGRGREKRYLAQLKVDAVITANETRKQTRVRLLRTCNRGRPFATATLALQYATQVRKRYRALKLAETLEVTHE